MTIKIPMKEPLCPVCGSPGAGLCPECFLGDNPFTVKPVNFNMCGCGKYQYKGGEYDNEEEVVALVARKSIKAPLGVKYRIKRVDRVWKSGRLHIDALIEGQVQGRDFHTRVGWDIKPEKHTCEVCKRLGSGYFEAVLQVRSEGLHPRVDGDKLCDIKEVRGGLDYYLTSNEHARSIADRLRGEGYLVKMSNQLFGNKNGRDIFRHYYSIKSPDFRVGDIFRHKNKLVQVVGMGRDVTLRNIVSGKMTKAGVNQLLEEKVVASDDEVREGMVTEVRPDGVQIMDSRTYETFDARVDDKNIIAGVGVRYVKIGKKYYFIDVA
jgi:nonsense-mediated mRNA decay protein 3